MATEQQLMEALKRADAAGETADAQAIATEIKRMRGAAPAETPPQPTPDQPQPSALEQKVSAELAGQPDFIRKQDFLGNLANQATFGFADDVSAAGLAGIGGGLTGVVDAIKQRDAGAIPRAIGREHAQIRETQKQRAGNFRQETPAQALASDVAGAAVGIGKVAPLFKGAGQQIAKRGGKSLALAVGGAGAGGTLGLGNSTGPVDERLAEAGKSALASAVAGPVINKLAPPLIGGLVNAGRAGARKAGVLPKLRKNTEANTPTTAQLKAQADELFDEGRKSGASARPGETADIAGQITRVAEAEGIVLNSGKIDKTLPGIKAVITKLDDVGGKTLTPEAMLTVRKTFERALKSKDANERRIAAIMMKKFDDFTDAFAPQFKAGRAISKRQKQGEEIQKAQKIAANKAERGKQNQDITLRTVFGNLQDRITKGTLKGFSDDAAEAIRRVAKGGVVRNRARDLGAVAPANPLGIGLGAGGAAFLGNLAGGPAGAVAAAGAVGTGGIVGRRVSERLARGAAKRVELLVRAGVPNETAKKLTVPQQDALLTSIAAVVGERAAGDER